jgi:hypothetical protein
MANTFLRTARVATYAFARPRATGWKPTVEARTMCSMTHVDALTRVLTERQDTPAVKRLRFRIRELGENAHDEVKQLDQLRKACREDPALSAAIVAETKQHSSSRLPAGHQKA